MADLNNGKIKQFVTAMLASTGGFVVGILMGWTNTVQQDVLHGAIGDAVTESEYSWIGALLILGAAIFSTPTNYIMDIIGRRLTMLLLALPITIGWLMLVLSTHIFFKCLARFMQGMCVGAFSTAVPLYVTEICEEENYKKFSPIFLLMINSGIFSMYMIGMNLNVVHLSWLCTIFAVTFVIAFMTMPESPVYLVNQNNDEEATNALKRLRSPHYDFEGEIQKIRETKKDRMDQSENIARDLGEAVTLRPLIVVMALIVLQQFSGFYAIIFYSSELFRSAKLDIKPNYGTVLLGLVLLAGSILSICIQNKFRRRIMLIISGVLISMSTFIIAFYFFITDLENKGTTSNDWVPISSLCLFMTSYAFAYGPIPWIIIDEIFSPTIKDVVISLATTIEWAAAFIVVKSYTVMKINIGLGATFTIYTLCTILCVTLIALFVIETKDKTLNELEAIMKPAITFASTPPPPPPSPPPPATSAKARKA